MFTNSMVNMILSANDIILLLIVNIDIQYNIVCIYDISIDTICINQHFLQSYANLIPIHLIMSLESEEWDPGIYNFKFSYLKLFIENSHSLFSFSLSISHTPLGFWTRNSFFNR